MQHGPELFDAFISQLRSAYQESVEATEGRLAVLTVFIGWTSDSQRRVDTRILAPQSSLDAIGHTEVITQLLTDALETFMYHEG